MNIRKASVVAVSLFLGLSWLVGVAICTWMVMLGFTALQDGSYVGSDRVGQAVCLAWLVLGWTGIAWSVRTAVRAIKSARQPRA